MTESISQATISLIDEYEKQISDCFKQLKKLPINLLFGQLKNAWLNNNRIYFCGNGGSAGNANHLANDLIYGAGLPSGLGLRVEALTANTSIITCLANDINYESIFSQQLRIKAQAGDVLIALSGSGNSPNIVKALQTGNEMGLSTFAILGFDGGKCKSIAQHSIHFEVSDMQVAEDMQMVVGHLCMKWLNENQPVRNKA